LGTIPRKSDIEFTTPRKLRSDFRAYGNLDFTSAIPGRESFDDAHIRFCVQVRQELQAALRGRVPLQQVTRSIRRGAGFTRHVDAFTAEFWRAENPQTGEERQIITGFEATGSVAAHSGFYRSAADAVKQNWPELEMRIIGAAIRWFQENVASPSSATPAAAGTAKWHHRSHRGILSAQMLQHLGRLDAISGTRSTGDNPPETDVSSSDPVETLRFHTFTELAAWASNQAVTAERR
jgi:hypothetical protein